jgi:ketosteroid isomerase-like protein
MPQTNAATARRLYQDWNKRDFDHLASLYVGGGEIVLVGPGTRFQGPEGAKEHALMWADGFPDGRITIDKVIATDRDVVVQFTGTGTHTGTLKTPGGEIVATGRSVTLQVCDVLSFRAGRVSRLHSYFDSASLLMQLGVMPELPIATTA